MIPTADSPPHQGRRPAMIQPRLIPDRRFGGALGMETLPTHKEPWKGDTGTEK